MRLDVSIFRYLTKDDFRVLTAIEQGLKNHEYVPTTLIEVIAQLRRGGCQKVLRGLLKHKLIAHDSKKYDGYKLTYNGLDFLALRTMIARGHISNVGIRIGVGKEADIHVGWSPEGKKLALKFHRLGRISFRSIKNNRDYLQHRKSASWMYMSRLAATKEYAYNKALSDAGFRVPLAVDHNRHLIVMEFVEAYPLFQMRVLKDPGNVETKLFDLLVKLGTAGLIHGDFNEFNLMVGTNSGGEEKVTLIDFPQVVTMEHENAEFYFERDVQCVVTFFKKRFGLEVEGVPQFKEVFAEYRRLKLENSSETLELPTVEGDHLLLENFHSNQNAKKESDSEEEVDDDDDDDDDGPEDDENEEEQEESEDELTKQLRELGLESESDSDSDDETNHASDEDNIRDGLLEFKGNTRGCNPNVNTKADMHQGKKGHLLSEAFNTETFNMYDDDKEKDDNKENGNLMHHQSCLDIDSDDEAFLAGLESGQKIKKKTKNNRKSDNKLETRSDSDNNNSDSENDVENKENLNNENEEDPNSTVKQIADQIHVLQRKKRKKLTPEEIREKLKRKEKQQKMRGHNKTKPNRKAKNECRQAAKDLGY